MGDVLYTIFGTILVPNLKDSDTTRDVKHEDISTYLREGAMSIFEQQSYCF